MSYPEHLIENALSALDNHDDPCKAREDFFGDDRNITMADTAKLSGCGVGDGELCDTYVVSVQGVYGWEIK